VRLDALGGVTWREVRLQSPAALIGQILNDKAAGPPGKGKFGKGKSAKFKPGKSKSGKSKKGKSW